MIVFGLMVVELGDIFIRVQFLLLVWRGTVEKLVDSSDRFCWNRWLDRCSISRIVVIVRRSLAITVCVVSRMLRWMSSSLALSTFSFFNHSFSMTLLLTRKCCLLLQISLLIHVTFVLHESLLMLSTVTIIISLMLARSWCNIGWGLKTTHFSKLRIWHHYTVLHFTSEHSLSLISHSGICPRRQSFSSLIQCRLLSGLWLLFSVRLLQGGVLTTVHVRSLANLSWLIIRIVLTYSVLVAAITIAWCVLWKPLSFELL